MPASASSPAATPPSVVATRAADGSLAVSRPGIDREALVQLADWRHGAVASLDVTRALLAQRGLHLPDLHPASQFGARGGSASSTATDPPLPPSVVAPGASSPVGDLNGDGRDDVIVYDYDDALSMRALDGSDGSELWRRTAASSVDALAAPVADVTGDGRTDLFRLAIADVEEVSYANECQASRRGESCLYERSQTFRWSYGVISGADGTELWSRSAPGSVAFRYATEDSSRRLGTSYTYVRDESLSGVNYIAGLDPAGDHDGDGAADIVINMIDSDGRETFDIRQRLIVAEKVNYHESRRTTTRSEVVSGPTGSAILTRTVQDTPGISWLSAATQLVGDGTPDLLWEEARRTDETYSCTRLDAAGVGRSVRCRGQDSEYAHTVVAVDGATGDDRWTFSKAVWSGHASVVPDVSGDGVADVLATSWSEPLTWMISGAAGALVWQQPMTADAFHDGRVLTISGEGWYDEPFTVVVERYDGGTGQLVVSTEFELPSEVEDSYLDFVEIDVVDGLVAAARGQASIEDGEVVDSSSRLIVEDGEGGILRERVADGEVLFIDPFVDLDGDGTAEVVAKRLELVEYDGWASWWEVPTGFARLADGGELWQIRAGIAWLSDGGNQDGLPGHEVLATRYTDEAVIVSSLDGPTGAERWALPL